MDRIAANEQAEDALVLVEPGVVATLQAALRHPATWFFAVIWLIALGVVLLTGNARLLPMRLAIDLGCVLLSLGTLVLTQGSVPAFPRQRFISSFNLWAQLVVIGAVILSTMTVLGLLYTVAPRLVNLLLNPAFYFVLPTLLLLPLGVRLRELNLGPGWRSWRVTALWFAPLLVLLLIAATRGSASEPLWMLVIGNSFQNGFFEEFLWRGVVMSRLRILLDDGWSIMLSSLFFGVWHIRAEAHAANGNMLVALAITIITQASIGLGFAIVVYRTRNLSASSFIHVLWDTTFQALG